MGNTLNRQRLRLERSRWRAIAASLAVTLVAVILTYYAASRDPGVVTTTIQTVASALLAIGLVTLVYDLLIRQAFTRDVLDAVHISENLTNARVQRISNQLNLDWEAILAGCTNFSILLLDPSSWIEREWNHVLTAGRQRIVHVVAYLPKANTPGFGVLAEHLGFEHDEFEDRINNARSVCENMWNNAARGEPRLKKGSTLRIRLYDAVPGYGLVIADDHAVVTLPGSLDKSAGAGYVLVHFTGVAGSFPASWLSAQLGPLTELTDEYADDVK